MRFPLTVATTVVLVAGLSIVNVSVGAQRYQSTMSQGSFGDGVVSPAVVASWAATPAGQGATLDLLVLWRGTPGWFFASNGHGGGAGGSGSVSSATLHYGGLELRTTFDKATRALRVQDKDVQLNGDNVVLVDEVDSPGGAKIIGTKKIDPQLEDGHNIFALLRRAAELHPYLRCDVKFPDDRQKVMDLFCGLIIPK